MPRVFHVSDRPAIAVFEPRMPPTPTPNVASPVVWAVDLAHLPNYLLPRECPRVAFRATADTTKSDRDTFLGLAGAPHVVAIETPWLERAASSTLWVYEFSGDPFSCVDATAGYYVSSDRVVPTSCRAVASPLAELAALGAELRIVPSLRELAAAVTASSLAYSCIRLRNAGLGPAAF